jgi:predicted SprT family Zn-dependent metalloprotease
MSNFSRSDAHTIALAEMDKWGLIERGWSFKFCNRKRQMGYCSYKDSSIYVSIYHVEHDNKETVIGTIRHEIAHALHYFAYLDANRASDFSARYYTGRKWVQKVPPHGAEWKKFAIMVGASPSATCKTSTMSVNVQKRWRMVIVNQSVVEETPNRCDRFLKNLSKRYLRGQKQKTLGNLFLVRDGDWKRVQDGTMSVNELQYYQKLNIPHRFNEYLYAAA